MKNLVKRFGQFVNENHHDMFSPNAGDDDMLPKQNRYDRYEESGYDDEGNDLASEYNNDLETCDCIDFDDNGDCVECGSPEGMDRRMDRTLYGQADAYQRSKIDRQIDRHNMGKMSDRELSEAKKQEKIEALDAIDKKFAKMKPAKKSMPMKPMTKKNMEMEEEEEEETSMKPKMLFGKPLKPAKPETKTKTNKMPLKGGKPAFLFGKK